MRGELDTDGDLPPLDDTDVLASCAPAAGRTLAPAPPSPPSIDELLRRARDAPREELLDEPENGTLNPTALPGPEYEALSSGAVHDTPTAFAPAAYDELIARTGSPGAYDELITRTGSPEAQPSRPIAIPRPAMELAPAERPSQPIAIPRRAMEPPPATLTAAALPIPHRDDPPAAAALPIPRRDDPPAAAALPRTRGAMEPPAAVLTAAALPIPHRDDPPAAAAVRPHVPPAPPPGYVSTRKHRRPLPRPVKLALVFAGALVAVLLLGRSCASPPAVDAPVATMASDELPQGSSLRQRTELSASDFAPARARRIERIEPEAAQTGYLSVEERTARRAADPETPRRASRPAPQSKRTQPTEPIHRDMLDSYARPTAPRPRDEAERPLLVAAATTITATLRSELLVRGRSHARALASISAGPLAGAQLMGRARAIDGAVSIYFHRLVWPDGRDVRIKAEAVTDGELSAAPAPHERSVAGDVAGRTGRRAMGSVLGGGLLGGAVGDTIDAVDREDRSAAAPERTVSVAPGTTVDVFFEESVF